MTKALGVFAFLRQPWARFIGICVFTMILHSILKSLEESEDKNAGYKKSLATVTGVYQRIVTAPRTPAVRFTKMVEIDPVQDIATVSSLNVCAERGINQ